MIPFERDMAIADALARIRAAIAHHRLHATSCLFGDDPCSIEVELRKPDGSVAATGHGKGDPVSAGAGALFEAMEHYASMFDPRAFHCIPMPVDAVHKRLGMGIDTLLDAQPDRIIGCRLYRGLCDGSAHFLPTALVQPRYLGKKDPRDTFDYRGLARYSSNSGTAIGSTAAEAILHALNEAIERDAVSRWLHTQFHQQANTSLRVVRRASGDAAFERAWRESERALDDEIILVDATAHPVTATRLAFARHWPHAVHLYGAGSSMCPVHASERALNELVQQAIRTRHTPLMEAYSEETLARLAPWPPLRRACSADLPKRMRTASIDHVPAGRRNRWRAPADMARETALSLAGIDHAPLACSLPAAPGIAIRSVFVPGFSRYFLVGSGIPVAPG